MTFRFFHDDNNPWLQPHTVNEEGVAEIRFPNENINEIIKDDSKIFKKEKPNKTNLSDKYRLWREAE